MPTAEAAVLAVAQGEISRATAAEASLANRFLLGTQFNPVSSCLVLQQRAAGLQPVPTGVYWIQPGTNAPAFQVFCDMDTDGGGWTMVFKITAGSGVNPVSTWTSTTPTNEGAAAALSVSATPTVGAYANRIVSSMWNANGFTVNAARVHLYNNGAIQKFLRFNAAGSSSTSWYGSGSVVSSSWTDIPSAGFNFFSIPGDTNGYGRTWFISQTYGGCPGDLGWVCITSPDGTSPCPWENIAAKPALLYASGTRSVAWENGAGGLNAATADVFTVFVR